jgi:hypothetical protein
MFFLQTLLSCSFFRWLPTLGCALFAKKEMKSRGHEIRRWRRHTCRGIGGRRSRTRGTM